MADSILRLKVESQEYDNKLKQAAQGLTRYADECRKVGGTLEVVEKETLDYVRALGQMDTTSRTATGKLAEMKKTFTELSVVYKNMTDEEKNSPFGKALATSLDQLKGRIQDSKSQLDDINKSVNGGGGLTGALDSLSGKFGMSVQSLAGWGTALAAGKAALDVAKDAFFASEATVDEWGRVMDSNKSLYEGFLTSLNTGDISGFLSRIDSIVQAARAAYNELDRLGTMKTIQAPQMSAQQTENERMRMMIQTGRYIAPVDGRRASMQNGQLLTPDQIKRIEQQLQGGMQKVVTLVGNEVAQTGRAIDAVYNRQAQELGMSLSEFRKGTSSMAEFDKRMAGYQKYEQWRKDNSFTDAWGNRQVRPGNPYEEYKKWNTFRVDGDRYNDLVKLIQQRDQQADQAYSMQSQAYRTMNRAEGVTVSKLMRGGVTTNTPTTTIRTAHAATSKTEEQQNTARIAELVKQYQDLATASKTADDAQKAGLTERMAKIQGEIKILQDRNAELKKFADEAKQVQFPVGSLPQLNEQLKTLQTEQAKALDTKQWHDYQSQIEQTQYQIDALKGKWKDGLQATFKLNIEQQGSTDINTAKPDDVTVTFKADDADVLAKVRDIEGITIDDKTLTVTANTAEAYNKVQELLKSVDGKTVTFTVQPKMETGTSIQNDAGMSAYITSIKQQLETADYGTSLYNGLSAQLSDMTTLQNLVGASLKAGLGTAMFDAADATGKDFWTRAMEGSVEDIDWQAIVDKINEKLKDLGIEPIQIPIETVGKDVKAITQAARTTADVVGSIGDAFNAIEDPAAKVMGTVMQAIASVALGYAQATVAASQTGNPWVWAAFAISGLATMLSTISAIHSATGYAQGGIVKGNSYSGDNIYGGPDAMVNAGELVLTKAQQGNLASQLQEGGMRNMNLSGRIRGTDIILSVDRTLSLEGKQLLTWGR